MKEFLKKAGKTFWFCVAAGVFALVGTIIYTVTDSTTGYAVFLGGTGIALAFLSIVLIGVGAFVTVKFGARHFIPASVRFIALVPMCVALGILINDRVGLAADLLTWDSHNGLGWSVLYVSIVSIIFLLFAAITLVIGAFLGDKKKTN